ncbi:MAG: transporter substrate-binding domain-containing protein [Treponema sp.]|jgi:ABC-type amino acid transport substrate-binding protein|nr:transporter substrate-binding domain-containing protein [Treponema sp.]
MYKNKYTFSRAVGILACALLCSACTERQSPAAFTPHTLSPLETVRELAASNSAMTGPRSSDISIYPQEIQAILKRGEMVFAMTSMDQKPFFYTDEQTGLLIGLDVELAYEIANLLGVKAVFNREADSFDDVIMKVVNKEADIALSKISRTMRRAEMVRYTIPYITFRQGLLINRLELAKITSEKNLPGFITNFRGRLGVIKNSSYASYAATNFPNADLCLYDSWTETVDALFKGEILAAYRDEGEILIVTTSKSDASILMKIVFLTDKQDPIAMAVSSDAPLLQEWLNLFLESYLIQHKEELKTNKLVERHFDTI